MEDVQELKERISKLELHREYDVQLNLEQSEALADVVKKVDEIYIGWRWMVRIGKFCTALAAIVGTGWAIMRGIK